jgi:hypothetical protein
MHGTAPQVLGNDAILAWRSLQLETKYDPNLTSLRSRTPSTWGVLSGICRTALISDLGVQADLNITI